MRRVGCMTVRWRLMLMILLVVLFGAQTAAAEKYVVLVKGSSTLAGPVEILARAFESTHADCRAIVSGGGSSLGIKALLKKEIDVALASRAMTEKEKNGAKNSDQSVEEKVIGSDGLVIITNPGNPVSTLTVDQIRGIFTGRITTWDAVGGEKQDIQVFITDPKRHGTPKWFQKAILKGTAFTQSARLLPEYRNVILYTASKTAAVGFAPMAKALGAAGTINRIDIKADDESEAVSPSWSTLKSGAYPLKRSLYLYWNAATNKPCIKEFVEFLTARGVTLR